MELGLTMLANPATIILAGAGTELTDSRRYVDLVGLEAGRCQFKASLAVDVRIEYSLDAGSSWSTLVSEDTYVGTNPYVSTWQVLPDDAVLSANVLLRALGIGSILTTVNYVELEVR